MTETPQDPVLEEDTGKPLPNPYLNGLDASETYEEMDDPDGYEGDPAEPEVRGLLSVPHTQRDTDHTIAWLKADREAHRLIWRGKCLVRVRSARGLPAVAPSALAAQHMVPMSDRVHDPDKIIRGMVGFADDPNDDNPFGHVYTFIGRNAEHTPLVDTNDAFVLGGGSVVAYNWFKPHWGDSFQFASKSVNGFILDLPGVDNPNNHPVNHDPRYNIPALDYAIHRMEKAIIYWEKRHKTALVKALRVDLADLKGTRKEFAKKGGN